VVDTPSRENLWQAQTPQSFRFGIIHAAHLSAEEDGFIGTDDASLIERAGGDVCIVPGDYRNIKITTPEDLVLAEAFLASIEKGRLEQERDDFTQIFSHEIKNPMTAVIGSIDIIREGRLGPLNEEQIEYLQSAIDSCNEVVTMIDNLVDIRRFEAGKMSVTIQPVNPEEIIRKVAEQFARMAKHDDIGLSINIDSSIPDIAVDHRALVRILSNLLANSLKFTPEGGEIVVSCESIENNDIQRGRIPLHLPLPQSFLEMRSFVRISVRDTGDAIPLEELGHIFDRNYLSGNGTGREHGGAGLGLAFCKWATESFGGVIWAESEGDQGGEIVILLPCLP
jgi:signal transduction histidine kinase